MLEHSHHRSKTVMLIGVFIVSLLFFVPAITNVLFMASIPVSRWHLIPAALSAFLVCGWLSGRNWKDAVVSSLIGSCIVILCVLLSLKINDWTWDGNTYHKAITGFLKNGWNPLAESFFSFRDAHYPMFSYISAPWYDAYPKATETWAACFYAATGNIETGKCFNLAIVFAVICIVYAYLTDQNFLKSGQAAVCSVFFALNPIIIAQLFTYYNDGFLWHLLLICCFGLIYLTQNTSQIYERTSFFLIFATIGIGLNTKFSALAFFGILCIGFFVYWCAVCIRSTTDTGSRNRYIGKRFFFFVAAVVIALTVLGATSYVSNLLRYRNPLYGMIGEGAVDIITSQVSPIFRNLPRLVAFLASVFSKVSNTSTLQSVELKVPFTIEPNELLWQTNDTRVAGWGILFGGIFLVSILYFARNCRDLQKDAKVTHIILLLFGINLVWICALPAMSWARYYVAPIYLPVLAMLHLFRREKHGGGYALAAGGLALLLMINFLPNCQQNAELAKLTEQQQQELRLFHDIASRNRVVVDSTIQGGGEGHYFTLFDIQTENVTYEDIPDEENTHKLSLYFPLAYKVLDGPLSCNNLSDYLNALYDADYVVVISVKDEASCALTQDTIAQMQKLGLRFPLEGKYRSSYLAILDGKTCLAEEISQEAISCEQTINGNTLLVSSSGWDSGNTSSILINGTEYSVNGRGLNIVLMDRDTGHVMDSVCVDTFMDNSFRRK